jgi:hypothetical protein
MLPLIHEIIAIAPIALITEVALPVAGVGKSLATITKDALF